MTFEDFLANLTIELQHLEHEPDQFRVTYPRDPSSIRGRVSVGVGHQASPGMPSSPNFFPVALNNKSVWTDYFPDRVSSVVLLVGTAPAALLDLWRSNIAALDDGYLLPQLDLCAEDASPDSCLGLLMFLALLSGVPLQAIPRQWISYIDGWERGFASQVADSTEYGVLHNALVHGLVGDNLRSAWIQGLALLTACLCKGFDPRAIDLEAEDTVIARAGAVLRFERVSYERSHDVMTRLQVELPLAAHPERCLLVDAIVAEEQLLMGIQKVCSRTDRANSFFGRGYTLNALYRPIAMGDGNDMTVSLDPASGLSLRRLWEALEREEEDRWGGERPKANPRADLSGYPKGRRSDGSLAPEQPWYHDPDFTLVAAPKALADGRLASKLAWADVLAVLWKEYNPFNRVGIIAGAAAFELALRPSKDSTTNLQACPDEAVGRASGRRKLRIGRWTRPNNNGPSLQWSPTLGRMLAACLQRSPSPLPVDFDALQAAPAHTHADFGSGLAVISEDGAFLLFHELAIGVPLREMQASFETCAVTMDWIDDHSTQVSDLVVAVRHHMSGQRTAPLNRDLQIYNQICTLQLDILRLRHELDAGTPDLPSQRFRDAIMHGWGVNGRLDTLYRDLDEAKTILTAHGDLVTNRRIAFLTYFGFPLALAGSAAGLMFDVNPIWPPLLANVNWPPLLAFMAIIILGSVIMFGFSWTGNRKARLSVLPPTSQGKSN